jgi:hypothetical protein
VARRRRGHLLHVEHVAARVPARARGAPVAPALRGRGWRRGCRHAALWRAAGAGVRRARVVCEGLRSVSLANDAGEAAPPVNGAACLRFRLAMAQFGPPDGASYDLYGAKGLTANMSACAAGMPLSASAPHFWAVQDEAVRAGVTGMRPDADAHGTFVVRLLICCDANISAAG